MSTYVSMVPSFKQLYTFLDKSGDGKLYTDELSKLFKEFERHAGTAAPKVKDTYMIISLFGTDGETSEDAPYMTIHVRLLP